jgi:type II secretory pathway pseudopilin PulG
VRPAERGFSLIEVLVVSAITIVMAAMAVPSITAALSNAALNSALDTVGTTVRNARHQAVTRNVRLRVRFNCPGPNQMRVVEVTGDAGIDGAVNRCNAVAFPYPAPDQNRATLPNNDGPVVIMAQSISFGAVQDIEISTVGRITPLIGCPGCVAAAPPATLAVGDLHQEKRLTISGSGQVTVSAVAYAR